MADRVANLALMLGRQSMGWLGRADARALAKEWSLPADFIARMINDERVRRFGDA